MRMRVKESYRKGEQTKGKQSDKRMHTGTVQSKQPTKRIVSNNFIVVFFLYKGEIKSNRIEESESTTKFSSSLILYMQLPKWIWMTKVVQGCYDNNASNTI